MVLAPRAFSLAGVVVWGMQAGGRGLAIVDVVGTGGVGGGAEQWVHGVSAELGGAKFHDEGRGGGRGRRVRSERSKVLVRRCWGRQCDGQQDPVLSALNG